MDLMIKSIKLFPEFRKFLVFQTLISFWENIYSKVQLIQAIQFPNIKIFQNFWSMKLIWLMML